MNLPKSKPALQRRRLLKTALLLPVAGPWLSACGGGGSSGGAEPELTQDAYAQAFEARRHQLYQGRVGQDLRHLSPNVFVRRRTYNNANFAFRCFWNREENFYPQANTAFMQALRFYLTADNQRFNPGDEWYWGFDQLAGLVEHYGSQGTHAPGLISAQAEELFYVFVRVHAEHYAVIDKAVSPSLRPYNTWQLWNSENHHAQRFMSLWHCLKLLAGHPQCKELALSDGRLPAQHLDLWNTYVAEYLLERGRKGLFVEASIYNTHTLKGIYNIYNFSPDPVIKRRAQAVLDLFWAEWAQEQIEGVRAGPQNRVYLNSSFTETQDEVGSPIHTLGWLYFGTGLTPAALIGQAFTVPATDYLPPLVVRHLAVRPRTEPYEIHNRRLALAVDGGYRPGTQYKLNQTTGATRSTYVAPEFCLGSWQRPSKPFTSWTMIASQNHCFGASFTSHMAARILFCINHRLSAYNAFRSVQKKAALCVQQLPYVTHGRLESGPDKPPPSVWVGELGMGLLHGVNDDGSTPEALVYKERDWIFGEADSGAFFALLVPAARTRWSARVEVLTSNRQEVAYAGRFLELEPAGQLSPIILELGRLQDWGSFGNFQQAVVANYPERQANHWFYRSLQGHVLEMPHDLNQLSRIDGQPLPVDGQTDAELGPNMGMHSPFLKSVYNSGRVDLRVDGHTHTIDFA